MRVLVTGGAGFIGRHVVDALRGAGHEVTALDALHPAAHRDRRMPDGVLLGDVRDAAVVATALHGCDIVVHQAAMVGMGVDLSDLPEKGSPLAFTIEVGIVPHARLGDYKGVEVGRREPKVDPDQVWALAVAPNVGT